MNKKIIAAARAVSVFLLLTACGHSAAQQTYPTRPIHFVVPFPPGGSTDPMARLVGQKLTEAWNQQVLVENRAGGDTIIGGEAVAKSAPDGYTILLVPSTQVAIPMLHRNVPFDVIKDFTPIATLASAEEVMVLNTTVPANTLQEFIALAKTKPDQLNYGSGGIGIMNHFAAEQFKIMAGVKINHIPYKGAGPALIDLIGGQIQMFMNSPLTLIPQIKSGKVKAIAITGNARSVALPQVPTFTESGLSGFDLRLWYGVLGPANMPRAITDKLSTEIGRILASADVREKLAGQGLDAFISTPDQLAALMKTDMARFAAIVKAANIQPEN